jgi:hypothetical protein
MNMNMQHGHGQSARTWTCSGLGIVALFKVVHGTFVNFSILPALRRLMMGTLTFSSVIYLKQ